MGSKDYDDERYDSGCEDEYYQESDDYEEEDLYDEEEEHNITDEDSILGEDCLPNRDWRILKLGDAKIRISNEGIITFVNTLFFSTKGYREVGTPYRYIQLEVFKGDFRKYYVHDLLWRAFNYEDPPEGWTVRHMKTSMDDEGCYENHIDNLDIYYDEIQKNYKISNII